MPFRIGGNVRSGADFLDPTWPSQQEAADLITIYGGKGHDLF